MRPATRYRTVPALMFGGLCVMLTSGAVGADDKDLKLNPAVPARTTSASRHRARPGYRLQAKTATDDEETPTADVPNLNLLEGLRAGDLIVQAEGTGDGRITLSVTNRTRKPLQVILPPGLIASGASGQFGGMGGMGGGMGGMGGMSGGMMGGGMGGGMGGMGGGMGGMGGGMGGMGGGMGRGGGTVPASMGMMMLGMMIMKLVGDRDSQ